MKKEAKRGKKNPTPCGAGFFLFTQAPLLLDNDIRKK